MKKLILFVVIFFFSLIDSRGQSLEEARAYFESGDYASCQAILFPSFIKVQKEYGKQTPDYQEAVSLLSNFVTQIGYYTLAERIALEDLNQCLRLYDKTDKRTANAFMRLGNIYKHQTNYLESDKYYKEAERIWAQILEDSLPANLLVHQGALLSEQGYYTAAEAMFRKAKVQYENTPKLDLANPTWLQLREEYAQLYTTLRNYTGAASLHQENLHYLQKNYSPSHPLKAQTYYHLADIYLENGLSEQAKVYFDSAKNTENYQTPNLVFLQKKLNASFASQTQNFAKADTIYENLLTFSNNFQGSHSRLRLDVMQEKARLYIQTQRYEEALALYEILEGEQLKYLSPEHPDYSKLMQDMAVAYWAVQKPRRSRKYFSKAIGIQLGQFRGASSFMSEREKTLFYRDAQVFFEQYYAFLYEQSQTNSSEKNLTQEMLESRMQTKALLFSTSLELKRKVEASKDSTLSDLYQRWKRGKEQLAKLYHLERMGSQVPDEMKVKLENYVNDLEKNLQLKTALSGQQEESSSFKINDLRKKLKNNEAAIEMIRIKHFSPNENTRDSISYVALVLLASQKKPLLIEIPASQELEDNHFQFYRNSITFQVEDTESYARFWQPIAEELDKFGINKVYFSADGIYNKVNLAGLLNPKTGQYLADEISMTLITNLKDLLEAPNSPTPLNSSLLIGYPDYNLENKPQSGNTERSFRGMTFSELPGTKSEVESIHQIFQSREQEALLLLSTDANEKNIKLHSSKKRVLHIATHGFFLPPIEDPKNNTSLSDQQFENPLLRCGILLSGAAQAYSPQTLREELELFLSGQNTEDGILTAYEVTNIDLRNTELVILSACETGLGQVRNGEGVYGFQRAFQTAGVKNVIMSLWKIDDTTTSRLMFNFYKEWLVNNKSKREAFRLAQARIRKDYPEPYYWAAFVMVGE